MLHWSDVNLIIALSEEQDVRNAGFAVRDVLYVIGPIRTAQEARKSTEPIVHLGAH